MTMRSRNGNDMSAGMEARSESPNYAVPSGYTDDEDHVDERVRLTRDLVIAARTMGPEEARYLVDAYYQTQENRKRTDNQVRAMGDDPGLLIQWMAERIARLRSRLLEPSMPIPLPILWATGCAVSLGLDQLFQLDFWPTLIWTTALLLVISGSLRGLQAHLKSRRKGGQPIE